jgi:hypothetical protein
MRYACTSACFCVNDKEMCSCVNSLLCVLVSVFENMFNFVHINIQKSHFMLFTANYTSSTYIYVYIYIYIHTYIHTCIHTHMHTYIHTHTYTCVFVCVCVRACRSRSVMSKLHIRAMKMHIQKRKTSKSTQADLAYIWLCDTLNAEQGRTHHLGTRLLGRFVAFSECRYRGRAQLGTRFVAWDALGSLGRAS